MLGIALIAQHVFGAELPLAGSAILCLILLILSIIDLRTGLLPNWLTLPLIALGLLQNWALENTLWPYLLGAVIGYLMIYSLAALWLRYRGEAGIGLGDAKLLAASGSWVGISHLPGVLLSASSAGLITVLLAQVLSRRKIDRRTAVPFGPFLAFGTWLMWCVMFVLVKKI